MDEIKTSKESKEKEQEVFITDITIHKVRHLRNIRIPLSKDERKHLILTGKNGSGKTSALQSLEQYLTGKFGSQLGMLRPDSFYEGFDDKVQEVSLKLSPCKKINEYISRGHFIISYYGAKRQVEMTTPKGVNKINLKEKYGLHDHPGKEFHQYIVNLRAQRAFANEKNDVKTIKKIENWFEIFENSLKEIFKDPSLRMAFDSENINFNIMQKGKDPFNFNTMADGYSALIDMVSDIILRMEKHKTKSYDLQGLVLIDELETHLHIDLQKKVFPFLTRFFPRIQFIVTTHSPFILNSIDNAIIYDLENKLLVEDLSGYSYDGIIEGYFRNDLYSDSVKKDLETYERLVHQKKRTEEEEERMMDLRIKLENIPDTLASELKVRFQQIELKRIRQHS